MSTNGQVRELPRGGHLDSVAVILGFSLGAPRVFDVYDDAGRLLVSDLHLASVSPWRLGLCPCIRQ